MREFLRGYATAELHGLDDRRLADVAGQVEALRSALATSADLRVALTDDALPVTVRAGIVSDLLTQADPATRSIVQFVVRSESPAELPPDVEWLSTRVAAETAFRQGGPDPDPPAGHHAVNERLEGYAIGAFASAQDSRVDRVEDELFRFSRTLESARDLRTTLSDPTLPAGLREAIVEDLLAAQADPITVQLVCYTVRQSRGQLGGHLSWLIECIAEERGRRTAEVATAVALGSAQRDSLTRTLSAVTGRTVSLQVSVEPDLLGGLRIVVGDTVLDGTVRRRLEQVRVALAQGGSSVTRNPEGRS